MRKNLIFIFLLFLSNFGFAQIHIWNDGWVSTNGNDHWHGFVVSPGGSTNTWPSTNASWSNCSAIYARTSTGMCWQVVDWVSTSSYYQQPRFYVTGDGAVTCTFLVQTNPQHSTAVTDDNTALENLCLLSVARSKVDSVYQDSIWNATDTINISSAVKEEMREEIGLGNYFLLADEVKRYIPEAVRVNVNGERGVSYSDITTLLVGALKSMKRIIDDQQEDLLLMKRQVSIASDEKILKGQTFSINEPSDAEKGLNFLSQNRPNPFSQNTTISYTVNELSNKASVLIFDMQGTLLKSYENLKKGEGELVILGSELKAGMYFYSLIVDDTEIDTRKMILTK